VTRLGEQFVSFFAVLLWVGGALALLAGLPELGGAIVVVIVVNGVFSFLQEFRAERAVQALQTLLPHEITVWRDGRESRRPSVDLVPGDLVCLTEGDQVPADIQLLSAENLRVDQSALSGEAHPVFKLPVAGDERAHVPRLERHELVFAGSAVVSGAASGVVIATGMGTEIGAVAHLTQAVVEEPSPLQREMARVTRIITALALAFGGGFLVLGVATRLLGLRDGFIFALGVIVANVPEGLLPTLTLALALGVQRLARRRSLVKRLSAVETLGATTVICTDKTGTLTEGRMTLAAVWVNGQTRAGDDIVDDAADMRSLFEAAVLASLATAEAGDPTEVALVRAAGRVGLDPQSLRTTHPLLAAHPFDSFRKRMTLVRAAATSPVACVKGAPRETLALCDTVRWNGRTVALDPELRRQCLTEHDRLASDGLRLLAVAERPLPSGHVGADAAAVERGLTLIGLIGLWDPPRPEVPEAVGLCRRAGIRVTVITGDYGLTAEAIGRRIGLRITKLVTGDEVGRMSPETLQSLVRESGVLFARMSPAHKLAVVQALKARGEVVTVTGDGVNDAPALKAAAVGVAMGGRGTEVAREAAEMVVTDDNFATIVAAIRQGRAIYSNMGKFVSYILASNVPELVPFLAFVFLGVPLPLTVMQILAVDLGTDLLPALALGAEPEEPGVMDRPPRGPRARLLTGRRLLHAYGFLGVIEAMLSLAGYFWTYWLAGWRPGLPMAASGELYRRATTMTLGGIVAAQVGNVFACRTVRESVFRIGFFSNPLVLLGIVAEIATLTGLIVIPSLRSVFGLELLGFSEWGLLLGFAPAVLLAEESRKLFVRRRLRGASAPPGAPSRVARTASP
jgi:calcium-translocating P-type ATPase